MMNRFMNMAVGAVLGQVLKHRIREGSIKAVKAYIEAVKYARFAVMGLVGLGVAAAIMVTGVLLTLVGILALMPIEAQTLAITVLVIGALMTLASGIGMYMLFNQKRWLEMSRSYEMMDAVLAPWPGVLPPNPVDVVKGNVHVPPAPTKEEIRRAREAEIRAHEMARRPMVAPMA